MARLSQQQVQDLTSTAGQHPEIAGAVTEEHRARLHTESALNALGSNNPARQSFLDWVALIIDSSKQKVFEHLMKDPLSTINVTESIFSEVKKVFEGQDRFIGYQFTNPNLRDDFELYLKTLQDQQFWKTKALSAIKNAYNSFIIVDLPIVDPDDVSTQADAENRGIKLIPKPTPYYYILPIKHVLQVEINPMRQAPEFIFFLDCDDPNTAYLFDDAFYRTFTRISGGKNFGGQWKMIGEVAHNLNYTPAKQIWSEPLSHNAKIRKRGLITNALGDLDRLLFKIVSEFHAELYSEYPIIATYQQKCDYQDPEGNVCEGGKVRRLIKSDGFASAQNMETFIICPKCMGAVKSMGAGSVVEAPAMASKDDPDLIDAVKFISVDPAVLDRINKKVADLKNDVTYSIIGIVDEVSDQAINKDQVLAQYESRQKILLDVKAKMEDIHKWVHETIAILRYDKAFISATVNYGTQFFLQNSAQLQDGYKDAKANGMPSYELSTMRSQIYETKYRSNPEMLQRVRILSNLEPYQDYSIAEIKDIMQVGDIFDERLLFMKLNFDTYILKFEREFTDVNSFMQYSDFKTKIDVMRETLLSYVDEDMAEKQAKEAPETAAPAPIAGEGGAAPAPAPGAGSGQANPPAPAPAPQPEPQPTT